MQFTTLTHTEFTNFERKCQTGNFFQSVPRANLRAKMGFRTYLVGVKESTKSAAKTTKSAKSTKPTAKVLAAALIVERDHEAWIQLGPILDYSDTKLLDFFLTEVIKYSRAQGFIKLEIFPPVVYGVRDLDGTYLSQPDTTPIFAAFSQHGFAHEGFTTEIENKANRWMFIKDLTGIKTLRDAELTMNSSTRKKLHKTQRELDIYILKSKSELPEWLTALQDSDLRNGVHTRSVQYFEDLWDAFGDEAIFVEARRKDNGELVSSEVDILHPNEMVAFVAGTVEKNKHFNGSTAIKGWNIEECLRRGQTRLNLYGMKGDFTPNNPLLYFKGGLRGVTEEYVGGFCLVLDRKKLLINKIRRRIKRILHR